MSYWGYPRYVSVGEKKANAARKLKQLRKKNPDIQPIVLEGNTLARTWWGKSWNVNLERYADYTNRIGRGRSYVRHGAVLDLQIRSGEVKALVQGSGSRPYSVTIKIKEIDKKVWKKIKDACEGKLESLSELLAGKFPKALGEIFTVKGQGLFPSPKEIKFDCSCPDWASMCKHVAAALYGIGARLDDDPSLFFKLRNVDVNDLIMQAAEGRAQKLLKKAERKSSRVMDDSNLSDVFGIEMDEPVKKTATAKRKPKQPVKKRVSKTEPAKKTVAAKKKSEQAVKKTSVKKTKSVKERTAKAEPVNEMTVKLKAVKETTVRAKPLKKKAPEKTVRETEENLPEFDRVVGVIRRSRKGVTVADIRKKTGLTVVQIRDAIFLAKKEGRIKNIRRGVYTKM